MSNRKKLVGDVYLPTGKVGLSVGPLRFFLVVHGYTGMTFEKVLQDVSQLGSVNQISARSRCFDVIDDHAGYALFAVGIDAQVVPQFESDDIGYVFMLGDRGDFVLGQLTHVDAILNSKHGSAMLPVVVPTP